MLLPKQNLVVCLLSMFLLVVQVIAGTVTNADIAKLAAAGMSDDVILSVISGGDSKFDTSPDALIALKEKGVSQTVLAAMANRQKSTESPSVMSSGVSSIGGIAVLSGKVLDCFGKPLAGGTVSVQNTTFSVSTGNAGDYSLPYVPGSIQVNYSKEGYYSQYLSLQIATAAQYPVGDMILSLAPPQAGIYYVSSDRYLPIEKARLTARDIQNNGANPLNPEEVTVINTWSAVGQPTVIQVTNNGTVTFIDNDGLFNECLQVLPTGEFYRRKVMGIGLGFEQEYKVLPENDKEVGPGVFSRTFSLTPGLYVFVTSQTPDFKDSIPQMGPAVVRFNEPLYLIRVVGHQENNSLVLPDSKAGAIRWLTTASSIRGNASSSSDNWPFEITEVQMDANGRFSAAIEWKTLSAIHKIEGIVSNDSINFTETEYIKKGDAALNCTYYFPLSSGSSELAGSWRDANQSGTATIQLN